MITNSNNITKYTMKMIIIVINTSNSNNSNCNTFTNIIISIIFSIGVEIRNIISL